LADAWLAMNMTILWQRLSSGFYKLEVGFSFSAHFFLPIAKFVCHLVWSAFQIVTSTMFYNSRIPSARTVLSCRPQEFVARYEKVGVGVMFLGKISTYYYRCSAYIYRQLCLADFQKNLENWEFWRNLSLFAENRSKSLIFTL